MILIICAWIYCFLLSLTIGAGFLKLISRFTGIALNLRFGIFYQFWFGFATVIGLLQLLSLFLPMGKTTFIILGILAALIIVLNAKSVVAKAIEFYHWLFTLRGLLSFLSVCFMLFVVAYSANREVEHSDTYIYHFNAVKWAKEYAVVPGLANLHGRLGFNSSFFLFAAFLEVGPYANESAHLAVSFLMAVCLIQWFFIITDRTEQMAKRIFCMLTALFIVNQIISQIEITSLSTDHPMSVLTLIFCLILLDKLDNKVLLLLPLAAVVFTFKLSGMLTIAFAVIILAGYLFVLKYNNENRTEKKAIARLHVVSFVLMCFIALGFIIRNVFVSGWLVYPFPIGNLHLPWSVPTPYVLDMMDWIKSYPKIPGGVSPTTIKENDFLFWFTQWIGRFKLTAEFNMLWVSLFILFWAVFQVKSFSRFIYARLNIAAVVAFGAVSILFWFTSAPEVRFGSIYFFVFFAGTVVLLYEGSRHKNVLRIFVYVLFIYQVVGRMPSYVFNKEPDLFTFAYTKPRKLVRVIASPPDQQPPLYIYMPAEGDACGNSPLPCTPYAGGYLHNHRLIRQRVPGNLSKGFLPTE